MFVMAYFSMLGTRIAAASGEPAELDEAMPPGWTEGGDGRLGKGGGWGNKKRPLYSDYQQKHQTM